MKPDQPSQDVNVLRQHFAVVPEPVIHPVFVVVSGLPGTGKSFFSRKLAERTPFLIVESDEMRKALFPNPDYSAEESSRLFKALHSLLEELLQKGISIILDATNLVEFQRERLYHIGDKIGVKLILIQVTAPAEVVRERLRQRANRKEISDKSDADWNVYEQMKTRVSSIKRNHFVVDTSQDIEPVIEKILRSIKR